MRKPDTTPMPNAKANTGKSNLAAESNDAAGVVYDLEPETFVKADSGVVGGSADGDGGVVRVGFDELGEEGGAEAAFALAGFDRERQLRD